MTDNIVIQDADLLGAIETVDTIIDLLRQLQAAGIEVTTERMALASVNDLRDDDNPLRTVARLSLLLAVALQRAAAQ